MAPVMRVGLSRPDPSSTTAGMAGVAFAFSESTHSTLAAAARQEIAAGMDSVHTTCTNSTKNGTNNRKKRTAPKEEQIFKIGRTEWLCVRARWRLRLVWRRTMKIHKKDDTTSKQHMALSKGDLLQVMKARLIG
ncbi:hypothetical protein ZWY2020_050618 [Hordeum vulgare]|nr:hypothetical protein ZWY2020_050618 [Hordeum vulgare]